MIPALLLLLAALPASAQTVRDAATRIEALQLPAGFEAPAQDLPQVPEIDRLRDVGVLDPYWWGTGRYGELAAAQQRYRDLSDESEAARRQSPRPSLPARGADGIDVGQARAGVTRRTADLPRYLQSHGAGPCVILTLYEPATKTAALAHLDATTGIRASIDLMLEKMGARPGPGVEAKLIGGMEGMSNDVFIAAIHKLDSLGIPIRELDVKLKSQQGGRIVPRRTERVEEVILYYLGDSIILDVETGLTYDMEGVPPEPYLARRPDLTRPHGLPVELEAGGLLGPR